MVHQHFRLVAPFTVAENVILGDHRGEGKKLVVNPRRIERRVAELGERYRIAVDPRARIWQLSLGEQQRVEILKALYREARVLILDEPTAVLTPQEADSLFATLRVMADEGRTIIFISHKLHEVKAVSDRVTVLRGGKTVATVGTAEATQRSLAALMVGREVALAQRVERDPERGEPVLEVRDLAAVGDRGGDALRDVSLTVRAGEIVGLAGLAGAGRSALARTLYGLRGSSYSGEIRMGGEAVNIRRPADAIRAGMALVPEDRKNAGLMLDATVLDNFALTAVGRGSALGLMSERRQAAQARDYVRDLRIKTPGLHAPARVLSGGNQQKLVIAKWLRMTPRLLILDEPTQGVDIGAKVEIYKLIAELVRDGRGVLLISSDLPELLALSDRIVALYRGRVMGELDRSAASDENVGRLIMGRSRSNGGG
jgi:simple sugar transport system ATP-binding protein